MPKSVSVSAELKLVLKRNLFPIKITTMYVRRKPSLAIEISSFLLSFIPLKIHVTYFYCQSSRSHNSSVKWAEKYINVYGVTFHCLYNSIQGHNEVIPVSLNSSSEWFIICMLLPLSWIQIDGTYFGCWWYHFLGRVSRRY